METVCLDIADVVRDEPIILKNKIEELRILGAFSVGVGRRGLRKSRGVARSAGRPAFTCAEVRMNRGG